MIQRNFLSPNRSVWHIRDVDFRKIAELFNITIYYAEDNGTWPFSYAIDGTERGTLYSRDVDALVAALQEYTMASE